MSEALKPCPNPWCSGKRIVIWDLYSKRVKCTCGVMGPRSETKMDTDQGVPLNNKTIDVCVAEAIDSWNTRAPATDEQAFANEKVKALVEALQFMYSVLGYAGNTGDDYLAEQARAANLTLRRTERNRLMTNENEKRIEELEGQLTAMTAERDRLEQRYQREVLGLNNEGDPIGGHPPIGLKARAALAGMGATDD